MTMSSASPVSRDNNITHIANGLVFGDRNADYGHPLKDFTRQATIWSQILGINVTPKQVALCMVGTKIAREINRPKDDNLVDLVGYALCYTRLNDPIDAGLPQQQIPIGASAPAVANPPVASISKRRFSAWVLGLVALSSLLAVLYCRAQFDANEQSVQLRRAVDVIRFQDSVIREVIKTEQQRKTPGTKIPARIVIERGV